MIEAKKEILLTAEQRAEHAETLKNIKKELKAKRDRIYNLLPFATELDNDELNEIEDYFIMLQLIPVFKDLTKPGAVLYELDIDILKDRGNDD